MPQTSVLTGEQFRGALKAGDVPADVLLRSSALPAEIKAGEGDRTVQFTISTASVDLMGDTIAVSGWKLDEYRANPVVLFQHDPTITIGVAERVWVEDGKLKAIADFHPPEISRFSDAIYRMLTHPKRFLRAVSVGFVPLKYAFTDDPARRYGVDYFEQKLLEFSVCSIPANRDCLSDAKAAGIDTAPVREWVERMLDGEGLAILPRKQLEAILGLPGKFRSMASSLPDKAKGARGQLIRCANYAERQITPEADQIAPEDDINTEADQPIDADPVNVPRQMSEDEKCRMESAKRTLDLIRARAV
jgi:hypothetical protein